MVCRSDNTCGSAASADASVAVDGALKDVQFSTLATLDPPFDPTVFSYDLAVSTLASVIGVIPTVSEGTAIEVNGVLSQEGQVSFLIPLSFGETLITVDLEKGEEKRSYVFRVHRDAQQVQQLVYGKSTPSFEEDFLGGSVAIEGDTLVVGAPREDLAAEDSGAVFVFFRSAGVWQQEAILKAPEPLGESLFGASVSLYKDELLVGAPNTSNATGLAYLFSRDIDHNWSFTTKLAASEPGNNDRFGVSVSLDGDRIAIGSPGDDFGKFPNSGAVYMFERSGPGWSQREYLKSPTLQAGATFGAAVDLDGNGLAVGAPLRDVPTPGQLIQNNAGAAYVYEIGEDAIVLQGTLQASNFDAQDEFGSSLALDGDRIAIGAPREDSSAAGIDGNQSSNGVEDSGAVYLFRRGGTGWQQEAYVKPSNPSGFDEFGSRISMLGELLAVGSASEDGGDSGVFDFGANGGNSASSSGAVYLYQRGNSGCSLRSFIKASNAEAEDLFGYGIDLSEDSLVISAVGEDGGTIGLGGEEGDNSALGSGAFYVFQ